jgi:hypothetical protein
MSLRSDPGDQKSRQHEKQIDAAPREPKDLSDAVEVAEITIVGALSVM